MNTQAIHIQAPEISGDNKKAVAGFAETGVSSKTVKVTYSSLTAAEKTIYDDFAALVDTLAG